MLEKVEQALRDVIAALQSAKLYETGHPIFKKALEKAFLGLEDLLREKEEVIFGIVGEEIAFEKEILFDLSRIIKSEVAYLKDRGIEKIIFYRGLHKEELHKFISFLTAPKETARQPQEYLMFMGIRNIAVGKLKVSSSPAKTEGEGSPLNQYRLSLDRVSQSLLDVLNRETVDHLNFRFALNNVMENLAREHRQLLKLTVLKRYDLGTFSHLLNVAILSMYFSSKLGFAKDTVMDMGIAALFHDIGKLYISRKIIRKTEGLTEEEFGKIKSHTVLGAELLLRYVDSLGILPVVVAFEHHLKYNLSGYPKLPFGRSPHIASSIVSICDVYDALSERRGYKTDYPPDMIYKLMLKEMGTSFDPELVKKFFEVIGVWPIGSIVALSDGRIAVVIDENEDDIEAPKVEIISPERKKEPLDLKMDKAGIKIERFLNPWKEGKEFLHLIESPPQET